MKTKPLLLLAILGISFSACKKKENVEQDQYIQGQLEQFQKNIVGRYQLDSYSSLPTQNIDPKDWPYTFVQINEATGGSYAVSLFDKNNVSIVSGKASLQARTVKEQEADNTYSAKLIFNFNTTPEEYILTMPRFYQLQLTRKREQNSLIYTYTYLLTKK